MIVGASKLYGICRCFVAIDASGLDAELIIKDQCLIAHPGQNVLQLIDADTVAPR